MIPQCRALARTTSTIRLVRSRATRVLLLVALALTNLTVHAEDAVPTVIELDAPPEVRPFITEQLELLKRSGTPLDTAGRLGIVRDARKQIPELLATEGYFHPDIEAHAEPPDKSGNARVRIKVEPRAQALIEAVRIEFSGDIATPGEEHARRTETLRSGWLLKAGEPFRQTRWAEAKQALLLRLQGEDYAAASLAESLAEVDPIRDKVKLRVVYDSGPPFTIGRLDVSGLQKYTPDLVERYNSLQPGERYSHERLLTLQTTLQNTPYFSSVLVDIDADPAHPNEVPVRVRVSESKPKRLGLGVGYSTNTGARVQLTYRHADLFNRAWNLVSGIQIEELRQFAYADIHLPPSSRAYRDSVGVLAENSDIQGLVTRRAAAGAVRTRTEGLIETRLALNLQRERTQAQDAEPTSLTALTLNWSWTRRDVDDPLDPRRGSVLNIQLGGATKVLISDQNFFRTYGRYQHYLPVGMRDVLILRTEAGLTAARSRDGIPQDFLFRAGGSQSLRGYAYQSLGVEQAGAIVGGRFLALGSAEYVHWLESDGGKWGTAFFYDFGNAVDERKDFRVLSGVGAGVRWKSPAGPLAFDLGYGVRDRRVRPHFSLAIAF